MGKIGGWPAKMRDVHVYLPEELIAKTDKYVRRGLYSSRTEMISDCVRRRIEELEKGTEPGSGDLAPLPASGLEPTVQHRQVMNDER